MKYGLGKFEGCGNYALVSQWVSANCDDEMGEVDCFGWFGKFEGKIKGHGPFYALVSEDSQGFVDVKWCDNKAELDEVWKELETEYEKDERPF